ncbi:MAG: hypothetical protein K6E54_09765 [Bacteroidaceae bacterium]|nr:hypothetical protein [Bacteroidaceae bacterium]
MKRQYMTLAELRADKDVAYAKLNKEVKQLQDDIVDSFLPERSYLDSSIPYMRYVGYGLTAYKTAKTVKKIFDFIHRRSWR